MSDKSKPDKSDKSDKSDKPDKSDPVFLNGEPPDDYLSLVRTTCESCRGKGSIKVCKVEIRCGVCKGKGYL